MNLTFYVHHTGSGSVFSENSNPDPKHLAGLRIWLRAHSGAVRKRSCPDTFGLNAWSSTYKTYLKTLSTLQNKAVKIVGGGKYFDRATPFYANLKILKLEELVLFEKAVFVFKSKTNSLPTQLDNYLKEITQVYKKGTKSSNQDKYFIQYRSRLNTKAHLYRMRGYKLKRNLNH